MKKGLLFTVILLMAAAVFGQQNVSAPQKFALVIGNGNYTHTTKLNNPVNDANDMAAALQTLGFTVEKVLDGTQDQMVNAVMRLKKRLSASRNSYGFLFYAGHGVQSGGENFLIPRDANIPSENFLRNRSVSVQEMLDELNDAGNEFNVVVLDACRNNPFSWQRSGNRGLTVVGVQPADSIIVFATAAGSTAADGTGKNGLFTQHLLNNLKTPGLEVTEVFRRTGADVARASGNQQRPAVYNQFYGTAYLGTRPAPVATAPAQPAPQPAPAPARPVQPTPNPAAEKEKNRYLHEAQRNVMSPSAFIFIGSGEADMEWWGTLLISLACTRLSGTIQDGKFGLNVELFNINYSPIPFLSLGIGAGGGVTFRDGGQWNWLGVKTYTGFTVPLWVDFDFGIRIFGDGFFEVGYSKWGSLSAGTAEPGFGLNPGFEAGLQFGGTDDEFSLHIEASYGITYYSDKRLKHTIGLTVRYRPEWWYRY